MQSLLSHNTFGIQAEAKNLIEYSSEEEITQILKQIPTEEKILHIGAGSNLLFTGNFDGTILHSRIEGIEIVETQQEEDRSYVCVRVGSGVTWDDFVAHCVSNGWQGVENLSLIPGEVGASAVQNIGAYGAEAADTIILVEAIELRTGTKRVFGNAECDYGYRHSIFKQQLKDKYAITHVTYRLRTDTQAPLQLDYGNLRESLTGNPTLLDVRNAIISIRNSKLPDPKVQGNAGSFFVNPVIELSTYTKLKENHPDMPHYPVDNAHVKVPAGWLIEHAGWKGRSLGRAAVHDRQALVIVNNGGASAQDIISLSEAIQKSVHERFGIKLSPEVIFV